MPHIQMNLGENLIAEGRERDFKRLKQFVTQLAQQKFNDGVATPKSMCASNHRHPMTGVSKVRAPKKSRLSEVEIKAAILSLPVVRRGKPIVASEFVIGSRVRRADLVVYAAELTAFEVKSDFDNLNRLSAQTLEYTKYFDKVVVVVTTRHIEKTLAMLGSNVEVWEINSDLEIQVKRKSSEPCVRYSSDLLKIMTKSEKIRYIGKDLSIDLLGNGALQAREAVTKAFMHRHIFHSQMFWKAVGRRKVQPAQLGLLSRFSEGRARARQQLAKNEQFWRDWHLESAQFFESCPEPRSIKNGA